MITEDQMREYLVNGGAMFRIEAIEVIRDGGNLAIETTSGNQWWVHKETKQFHSSYPPKQENLVEDPLLVAYLIDRIESYTKWTEEYLKQNKTALSSIKQAYDVES